MESIPSIRSTYPEIAANAALVLIGVACALLDRQIQAQAAAFTEEGGFTERLHRSLGYAAGCWPHPGAAPARGTRGLAQQRRASGNADPSPEFYLRLRPGRLDQYSGLRLRCMTAATKMVCPSIA